MASLSYVGNALQILNCSIIVTQCFGFFLPSLRKNWAENAELQWKTQQKEAHVI